MNAVYILLAMLVWGVLHSFTASLTLKEKMAQVFGAGFTRLYRLLYNGFALLTFLPVMALVAMLPSQILYTVSSPWKYLMGAGQGAAAFLLLVAVMQTDALHFAGIKQLFMQETKSVLVTNGLYQWVRHPIYTLSLLFLWLTSSMSDTSLVFYIGITLYFIAGAMFEERKLLREFGDAYLKYKKQTPMLIPWIL